LNKTDLLFYEREVRKAGYRCIAGVDEAGRGPLAGPVVAAAVIFPCDHESIDGINDSKKLSPKQRATLKPIIESKALYIGLGIISEQEIDRLNILQATLLAMKQAILSLRLLPDYLLIDGRDAPRCDIAHRCLIHGDGLSLSIAAASIIAKITRDEIMLEYDKQYPRYGFAQHKGYGTLRHLQAIRCYGLSPIHRRSFKPKVLQDLYV